MSSARTHAGRYLLPPVWFALFPSLYLSLLPFLTLGRPLLEWKTTLAAGLLLPLLLLLLQRHGYLDLERLWQRTLTCTLLLAVLLAFFLSASLLLRLALRRRLESEESLLLFLLLAALTSGPLLEAIGRAVNRFFPLQSPDYQALLCDFSARIATTLYLPDLIRILTTELPKQLLIARVGLMILEENRSRLYPEELRFGTAPWPESRLLSLLRSGSQFFLCRPERNDPHLTRELGEINSAGFSLVYGLQGASRFGGLLLLGPREDGVPYSRRDLQLFSTLANQVNIAVENARNYESLAESKEQLQLVYDKLVQAEKLAALGELTAVLAHELKNPLGVIRGSAQYLASGQRGPEMQEELLHYIMDEVDNLNLVINNLLGLARHKPPSFQALDLPRELAAFICQWQQGGEHNPAVAIILTTPESLPVLYADARQLRQVLFNCIANSEEVMPEGGTIRITVRQPDDDQVEIVITDTGPGIAEEDLKLVFKKFFTTKEKGVGLGLPVCRQIVRAHNGSIRLMNQAGGGVKVVIRLPRRPLASISPEVLPARNEPKAILPRLWSSEY